MRFLALLAALSCAALGVACSSSTSNNNNTCSLPTGQECCDGDVLGTFSCDDQGKAVCSQGTRLTPSNECTLPLPLRDAGQDAKACALPTGQECCDGDVLGTFSCDATGKVVCSEGTRLTPSNQCTLPLPYDGGSDADAGACALPAGQQCCDGDVLGTFTCDSHGAVVCSQGTHLMPLNQCGLPPPPDGDNDAGH